MIAITESEAFRRGIRPVLRIVPQEKAKEIVRFRPDPGLRARIEELAEKSTEGHLSAVERKEYEGYIRANKFIAILQRQARRLTGTTRRR